MRTSHHLCKEHHELARCQLFLDQELRQQRRAQPRKRCLRHHGELFKGRPARRGNIVHLHLLKPRGPRRRAGRLMEQLDACQIGRVLQPMPRLERWTAYGNDLFIHQVMRLSARPIRRAIVDRRIERFGSEVERLRAGRKINRRIRMLVKESVQTRDQPSRGERWQYRQTKQLRIAPRCDAMRRISKIAQNSADIAEIQLTCFGDHDSLPNARKQGYLEQIFQLSYLPAYGTLSQVQLRRCTRHASMPRHTLKRLQPRGGRVRGHRASHSGLEVLDDPHAADSKGREPQGTL